MVLAADLVAAIRATQREPAYPEYKYKPPWAYDSDRAWQSRSEHGRVYVAGAYCCALELADPDHHCLDVVVQQDEILKVLGLTLLIYAMPERFARVGR